VKPIVAASSYIGRAPTPPLKFSISCGKLGSSAA
jgi:hypothetical protein